MSEAQNPITAYPLSPGQRALWFLQQLNPGSTAYNVARAVRIRMPLDVEAFRRAWQTLTDRHPALRATFTATDHGPAQIVHPHWPVDFILADASAWTPAQLDAQLAAETYRPFDLSGAPQIRLRLYQRAADDFILLFVLHHIICDLWSLILLLLEVPQLYQAELSGAPARLRPVRAQYTDFARTQDELLAGPEGERLWDYWRERLRGAAPALDLPTDRPRPATPTDHAAAVAHTFDAALTAPQSGEREPRNGSPAQAPLAPAPQSGEREPRNGSPAQAPLAPAPQSGEREPRNGSPAQAPHAPAPQSGEREPRNGSPAQAPLAPAPLRALAETHGATLHSLVLTAFQTLLHRYSGQTDIVVASPRAGRTAGVSNVIGYFVNPVPVRADCAGDPPFAELLTRAAREVEADFAHGAYPFPLLVERLQPERDLSRNPLTQVAFAWQKTTRLADWNVIAAINAGAAGVRFETAGMQLESIHFTHRVSVMDLTLQVIETGDGLSAVLEYNTALFDEATAARLLGHLEQLLRGIVARPEARLSELPLLTEAERNQLATWNATQRDYAVEEPFHRLFERRAAEQPNAVAVSFGGQTLTYAELDARANLLAAHLRKLGVARGARVGLCFERSPEYVVGVLGTLKAGGVFVPLDPAYPPDRLAFMFADAQLAMLLTQAALLPGLPPHSTPTLCLDAEWPRIAQSPPANPQPSVGGDDPAYMIYTSGSTGQPKGALLPQRGLRNLAEYQRRAFALGPGDRVLQFASLSFDASVWEVAMALASGATLCLASREILASPPDLHRLLREGAITAVTLPPSLLHVLSAEDLPALRVVISAGEACSRALVQKWGAGRAFFNAYGPTEATVCASVARCDPNDPRPPSIGGPIDNCALHVVDARLQPVPIGVVGELLIGGAPVGLGYHNRPELTAEKFVAVPALTADEGRATEVEAAAAVHRPSSSDFYRTGDLVRRRADGTLEFCGRADQQVKIRGFRVELGEIEAVLVQHPAVREAVVVASDVKLNGRADLRLVAFVVRRADSVTAEALREHLRARLPDYMLPAAIVWLDALALTPSGKVDRPALPMPDWAALLPAHSAPPRTPLEEALVNIWAEVLGLPHVGIRDNFFELGGHSLLATQVASRLRATFGVELPLRTLFEAQTVERLAARIEAALKGGGARLPATIQPAARDGALPLSLSQERMWFIHQLAPNSAAYNVPGIIRLRGALNLPALRGALAAIVRRHESLRTTFTVVEGQPAQQISSQVELSWEMVDVSALAVEARESEALRLAEAEARRPFDLITGPLLRTVCVRLAEDDHLLVFNLHHTISDAWSLRVLLVELQSHYQAALRGHVAGLPDLPIQYADYAVWQRGWLQGEALRAQLDYWREQLRGVTKLELPTDRPRPARQTYRGEFIARDLPAPLMAALRSLSRAEGASLFMTLFAAFAALLYRYSGQDDIAIGVPIANRHHLASEHIIGSLVNTLVLRADLSGEPSFRALLKRAREVALEAYAHQDLPFAKLVAELQPDRDLSYSPLVQVMFNVINVPMPAPTLGGLQLEFPVIDRGAAQFDLTLTVIDLPVMQRAAIEYNTDLFERATIERMLGHFTTLLAALAGDADRPVTQLPLLTDAERHQVLVEWNDTRADNDLERGLHHVFEAQAARTPDATALIFEGRRMTFAELNTRANQLAHSLRGLGVGPGTLVAVCLERSPELIVALFGILKAGAAYVPLDPTYPKDRLAYMLSDSRAPVLLTQKNLVKWLPAENVRAVCLDAEWPRIAQSAVANPPSSVGGDDLAYVIYTSGSTGQPKGVQASHRGALNRFEWMWARYPFAAGEVCCQKTALSFVDSVWEIFGPLLRGVPLVIVPEAVGRDPVRLVKLLAAERVTRIVLVPSLLKVILDTHADLDAHWPSLRLCVSSGEALTQELTRRFYAAIPWALLLNLYGSSEAAGDSLYYEARADDPRGIVPIGRPIANTQVYLLDAHGQPVPIGVRGEICLGGAGLARGYLNRPELTSERFVIGHWLLSSQLPMTNNHAPRLFRTGDLGVYRPDGVIEYAGRRDHQVKIRGFRIELGELESVLRQHPALREAVVMARANSRDEQQLVAYCVPQRGAEANSQNVREFLQGRVPGFMIPAAWVFLEALPLTPNGKVDRKALPAPEAAPVEERPYIAPHDAVQAQLAQIWERVLDVQPIGITESFFDLGGHSLLAVRLFAEIEALTGHQLPVASLFASPTIEAQAALLQREGWKPSWATLVPIRTGGVRLPFYCVHEVDGNAFYYHELARHLGDDQPVYGLQARGLDGRTPPHARVEDMAACYVEEIQRFQSKGPYYLGGSSLGGLVAFEMARLLHAQGQIVGLLALFDTWSPAYTRLLQLPLPVRLGRHFGTLAELGVVEWLGNAAERMRPQINPTPWFKNRTEALQRLREYRRRAQAGPLPPDLRDFHLREVLSAAAREYRPQPYTGKVTFFSAAEQPERYYHQPRITRDYLLEAGFVGRGDVERVWREVYPLGWEALALGGLDVHVVPGPHGFMVREPHVKALGAALRAALAEAQSVRTESLAQ
jgi:amino acid adenylation domain-containing protein